MKKSLLVFLSLFIFSFAFAGFGGSRSSFSGSRSYSRSYSSPSRSFGGSRSVPSRSSAPIYRPQVREVSPPVVHERVIHHDSGMNNLATGMIMGHMLSRPTTVIAAPSAPVVVEAPQATGDYMVAPAESSGMGFWGYLFTFLVIGGIVYAAYLFFVKRGQRY